MKHYYVYAHRRLDNDSIFYIGKGCNKRAWSTNNRNDYWHNIVNRFGYSVEILHSNLEEQEALDKECELIKSLNPSTNFTKGGDGGDTFSKLPEENKIKLIKEATKRAHQHNGGVAIAATIRRGKSKNTDTGLQSMAEKHSITFSGAGNPMYGKSHWNDKTEDQKEKIKEKTSLSLKKTYKNCPRKYKVVICPICNKSGGQPGMTRYHFENCGASK